MEASAACGEATAALPRRVVRIVVRSHVEQRRLRGLDGMSPAIGYCLWQRICQWMCQCRAAGHAENDRIDSRYSSVLSVLTAQSV
jgi:hypothetical protein